MSSTHPTSAVEPVVRPGPAWLRRALAVPGKFGLYQLIRFGAVFAQLVLLTLVVRTFDIEGAAFFKVMTIACAAFVVHHFLPAKARMAAFAAVSLAGIYLVLGRSNAIQIVGFGLVLIGLAHLPVRFALRVALILAAGAALAAIRVGVLKAPVSATIWPIFGAMFMFRMIVYLYDLNNRSAPFGPARALSYFFMLPNVCFPLFPVVDYKAFSRSHYDDEDIRIYQTGAEWMFRGVLQLLLYRFVYQHMLVGPETVTTSLGAAQFMVTAYLMYLKISGSFHLIIGMLHLFGFNLGPANNKYFLSESFTDYWRRINIYWKDFLQKVFFNPVYFRLNKRMGGTAALVLATLIAFFVTWALHSYQWFWIRGKFPVVWQDIVFWSIMGLLVLGNMLWENKYGRQRSLKKVRHSFASEFKLALRTVGTFVVVCLSWVIWSSESFSEVTSILGRLVRTDARSLAVILGSLAALGLIAVVVARADRKKTGASGLLRKKQAPAPFWGGAWHVGASCVVLLVLAYAPLVFDVDPAVFNTFDNLKSSRLNQRDAQMLDRGYYEDLTDVVRFNSGLGDIYNQRPPDWDRNWAMRPVDDCPDYELMPNKKVLHKGAMMSTNRWGMRDRDCEKQKPAGTYRVALCGASHSMGTGVEDDEVYDNVAEDRLNAGRAAAGDSLRIEILNFSVGGFGPIQRLADIDRKVLEFEFDALACEGIDDIYWVVKDVVDAAQNDLPVPYEYIRTVIAESGVGNGMSHSQGMETLKPRAEELLAWVYGEIAKRARDRGATPMLVCIPHTGAITDEKRALVERQIAIAREAGFTVLDIRDAYDGVELKSLWIAPWDSHPDATGHRLLADRLYAAIRAQGI